jgi:hypothetical protein
MPFRRYPRPGANRDSGIIRSMLRLELLENRLLPTLRQFARGWASNSGWAVDIAGSNPGRNYQCRQWRCAGGATHHFPRCKKVPTYFFRFRLPGPWACF